MFFSCAGSSCGAAKVAGFTDHTLPRYRVLEPRLFFGQIWIYLNPQRFACLSVCEGQTCLLATRMHEAHASLQTADGSGHREPDSRIHFEQCFCDACHHPDAVWPARGKWFCIDARGGARPGCCAGDRGKSRKRKFPECSSAGFGQSAIQETFGRHIDPRIEDQCIEQQPISGAVCCTLYQFNGCCPSCCSGIKPCGAKPDSVASAAAGAGGARVRLHKSKCSAQLFGVEPQRDQPDFTKPRAEWEGAESSCTECDCRKRASFNSSFTKSNFAKPNCRQPDGWR